MKKNDIIALKVHSERIGQNLDLVQSAGGNTSLKLEGKIWIKASGMRLRDALHKEIFVDFSYSGMTLHDILSISSFPEFETCELRPSIETNFHMLINKKFVTHLHSLGSIALGVLDLDSHTLNNFLQTSDSVKVDYRRPGVDLASQISQTNFYDSKVVLLMNHGVILAADEIPELESKIHGFESELIGFVTGIPTSSSFPSWVDILTEGVLTPDEAVFLGRTPFTKSKNLIPDSIAITPDGTLLFHENTSVDRIDMAHFYVRVAKLIERKAAIRYLPTSEIDYLLNWDKEKMRIEMSR